MRDEDAVNVDADADEDAGQWDAEDAAEDVAEAAVEEMAGPWDPLEITTDRSWNLRIP